MKASTQQPQQKKKAFLFVFLGLLVSLLTSAPSCANHYHMGATNHHQGPTPSQGFSQGSSYYNSSSSREALLKQDEKDVYISVEKQFASQEALVDRKLAFRERAVEFIEKRKEIDATLANSSEEERKSIVISSRELAKVASPLLLTKSLDIPTEQANAAEDILSLADLMLDSALYFNPLTGIGAALYSAFTGTTLSGGSLSDDERASELLTVALITFPFGKAIKMAESVSKFISKPFAVKAGELAHRIAIRSEGFEKFVAKPEFTERLRRYFSLGEEWTVKATRAKKGGEPGLQLMRDRGTHIRFMNGKTTSPHEVSRNPYVVIYKNGVKVDRGVEGHIPFQQLTPDFVREVLL